MKIGRKLFEGKNIASGSSVSRIEYCNYMKMCVKILLIEIYKKMEMELFKSIFD